MLKVSIVFNIVFMMLLLHFHLTTYVPKEILARMKMKKLCQKINDVISSSENVPANIDEFLDMTKMSKDNLYDLHGRPFDIEIYKSYMTIKSYPYKNDKTFFVYYKHDIDSYGLFADLISRLGSGDELNSDEHEKLKEYERKVSKINSIFLEFR